MTGRAGAPLDTPPPGQVSRGSGELAAPFCICQSFTALLSDVAGEQAESSVHGPPAAPPAPAPCPDSGRPAPCPASRDPPHRMSRGERRAARYPGRRPRDVSYARLPAPAGPAMAEPIRPGPPGGRGRFVRPLLAEQLPDADSDDGVRFRSRDTGANQARRGAVGGLEHRVDLGLYGGRVFVQVDAKGQTNGTLASLRGRASDTTRAVLDFSRSGNRASPMHQGASAPQ
jgi:hypothetical protein